MSVIAAEATSSYTWPQTIIVLGVLLAVMFFAAGAAATYVEIRKTKIAAGQENAEALKAGAEFRDCASGCPAPG